MPWWGWLLLGLLVPVALWVLLVVVFFVIAQARIMLHHPEDPAVDKTWRPYAEKVKTAIQAVRKLPREDAELVSRDGLRLRARLYPASHARGTIVLMHGFRGEGMRDFVSVVPFYHRLGLNVLVPDQRAHGRSQGHWICYGAKERYDCLAWMRWVNARMGEDAPLFLGGVSMGGATVLMTLGLDIPGNLRGVVADCAFTDPWAIMRHVCVDMYHLPACLLMRPCCWLSRLITGWDYRSVSAKEILRTCHTPVLFIHGSADHFVPTEMRRQNYEACAAEKRLVIVEGAQHAVSYLQDTPLYEREVEAFVNAHLS